MSNYPDGMSKSDLDHVHGVTCGYSDWIQDNLLELEDEFFAEEGFEGLDPKKLWGLYPNVDEMTDAIVDQAYVQHGSSLFDKKRWESFVDRKWEAHCGGHSHINYDN